MFVQGCNFHCYNCFNKDTWDFNGGNEWTQEVEDKFIELASRPYIKRISILGGEPLTDENLDGVLNLINKIRLLFGQSKTIWLYSGYYFNQLFPSGDYKKWIEYSKIQRDKICKMRMIIAQCDVMVDGNYIDQLRNVQLKYRGSENQNVIDIKKSLEQNKVVLYCD